MKFQFDFEENKVRYDKISTSSVLKLLCLTSIASSVLLLYKVFHCFLYFISKGFVGPIIVQAMKKLLFVFYVKCDYSQLHKLQINALIAIYKTVLIYS